MAALKHRKINYLDSSYKLTNDSLLWRDYVNVKTFGATGDGTTNDRAAFVAAVATGRNVFVPPGTYKISASFLLQADQTMFGLGNTSVLYTTANDRIVQMGTRSRVTGLKFLGSGKAAGLTFQTGVFLYQYVGWSIDNCYFEAFSGAAQQNGGGGICGGALAASNSDGGRISNCYFYNNNGGLNLMQRSEYVTVTGCSFGSNTVAIGLGTGNVTVNNNVIHNNTTGIKSYTGTNDAHSIVSNNLINHNTYPLDIQNVAYSLSNSYSNNMIYYGAIKITNSNNIRFQGGTMDQMDSIHLTNSRFLQRVNVYVGTTQAGAVIPVKKYGNSDDFQIIGEMGKDSATRSDFLKMIREDTVTLKLPTAPGVYNVRIDANGNLSKADTATGGGSTDTTSLSNRINAKLDTANTYSWEFLSDSVSIHGRDGAELWYIPEQDSIMMFGGWHRDSTPASTKQVYKYDNQMQNWRRLADAPWTNGLHCFGSHYQNDTVYVWGGDAESPSTQEFWSFKVSTETWTLIRSSIVSARYSYGDAWIDNEAYMIGGNQTGSTDSTNAITEIVKGKPDGTAWSTVQTGLTKFGGIYSGSGTYFNGYLYMIAGVGYATAEEDRDYKVSVWRSSDKGVTWEQRGDVPFQKQGYFGKGKGFIKLKPNYDGDKLGLFFGYQRVPAVGIKDFGECLWMDVNEKWHYMAGIPKTAKGDSLNMENRHAAAVTAMPDDSWIIATGYGVIMANDAWRVYPYDGTIKDEGNYFAKPIKIGTRDNYPVKIIVNDTLSAQFKRDSINFNAALISIYDNDLNPITSGEKTTLRLKTPSAGQKLQFYTNGDSAYIRHATTQGGVVGGVRITGSTLPVINMFNTGRIHIGFNGLIQDNTTSGNFMTVTSPSSSGPILTLRQASSADRFIFNGDGTIQITQSIGNTFLSFGTINGVNGSKIVTTAIPFGIRVNGNDVFNIAHSTAYADISTRLGINNASPLSRLDVGGAIASAITTTTGNLTLDISHSTVIITGGTPTITLPTASGCTRRKYRVVNQTGSGVTVSSYLDFAGASSTTIAANSAIEFQSNGTSWYRVL